MSRNGKKIIVDEFEAMAHLRAKQPGSELWSRSATVAKKMGPKLPPVPEDDLFQEHNVTGSTGSGSSASVYYRSGNTFSHVTTQHPIANNVGRSKTRTDSTYSIRNTGDKGESQEFYGGGVRHTSRNPYVSVKSATDKNTLHATASSITSHKSKYDKK